MEVYAASPVDDLQENPDNGEDALIGDDDDELAFQNRYIYPVFSYSYKSH